MSMFIQGDLVQFLGLLFLDQFLGLLFLDLFTPTWILFLQVEIVNNSHVGLICRNGAGLMNDRAKYLHTFSHQFPTPCALSNSGNSGWEVQLSLWSIIKVLLWVLQGHLGALSHQLQLSERWIPSSTHTSSCRLFSLEFGWGVPQRDHHYCCRLSHVDQSSAPKFSIVTQHPDFSYGQYMLWGFFSLLTSNSTTSVGSVSI